MFGVSSITTQQVWQLISSSQGVYGAYFSKMNYWWSKNVRGGTWLRNHPISEVLLVNMFPSALAYISHRVCIGHTGHHPPVFSQSLYPSWGHRTCIQSLRRMPPR